MDTPIVARPTDDSISVPRERLQNWIDVIHDNERSLGDRLQSLSSIFASLLNGDAVDKYPLSIIREQSVQVDDNAIFDLMVKEGIAYHVDTRNRVHMFPLNAVEIKDCIQVAVRAFHPPPVYTCECSQATIPSGENK